MPRTPLRRSHRRPTRAEVVSRARRATTLLGGLAGCAIGLAIWIWISSDSALEQRYAIAEELLELRGTEQAQAAAQGEALGPDPEFERGRHLVTVVAQCPFCHGTDLGGQEMADDPWIGRLDAPNLTKGRGGLGPDYQRADWVRAIRYGIGRDGRSLLLMPSVHLARMSDVDLLAVIRFLESVPEVDRSTRPFRVGALTRLALWTGQADELLAARAVDRDQIGPDAREADVSRDYGRYLVDLGSCRICHHADLRGGLHPLALPGEPPPPDLRPGAALAGWSRTDFDRAMRSGRTPEGRQLDREYMPWPAFAGLAPKEIDALWLYLQGPTLPDEEPDEEPEEGPEEGLGVASIKRLD